MHLPWKGRTQARAPIWVYGVPLLLFVISAAPYVGLRTEASIAMFSNLHTEGGTTNHLVIKRSQHWFDYQRDVAMIRDASDPAMQHLASRNLGLVTSAVHEYLRKHPEHWVTFDLDGARQLTAASLNAAAHANWFERMFLIFKPVDFSRH